jgi:hypothetical protein
MQKGLFDELPKEDQPTPMAHLLDLKIEPRKKNEINKKIEKIKKLKEKFERLRSRVNELKDIYEQQVGPLEKELIENKEAFIKKLFGRYKEKGFAQWQTEMISTVIFNEITEIENRGDTSERVDQIKKELKDLMEAKMSDEEKSMMREMAKEFMKFTGMNVDEDFDIFDESRFEEARQRSNEYHEKEEHEQEEQQKRDKVLKTDKDFQKLYKSLVKKVHPDLVIDPMEKEKRELLMKELSHAWEERDYYNLLMLKSQIEPGEDAIDLGKEQTKMLVKQLNEEINNWESKHYMLKHMDSNTSFYFENFYALHQSTSVKKFEKYKGLLLNQSEVALHHLAQIKTKKATKEFLKATRETLLDEEDDHFDFF